MIVLKERTKTVKYPGRGMRGVSEQLMLDIATIVRLGRSSRSEKAAVPQKMGDILQAPIKD